MRARYDFVLRPSARGTTFQEAPRQKGAQNMRQTSFKFRSRGGQARELRPQAVRARTPGFVMRSARC